MTPPAWSPRFSLTPAVACGLMQIEAASTLVDHTPLSPAAEVELRARARVRAAHYSTFIEGNHLTLQEAGVVIADEHAEISGRERDVSEIRNYWNALLRVEEWARKKKPLSEDLIKRLHALVERGPRTKPTSYRDGQNAIKNSATGALIYLPPEAKDIPDLMASLVDWANEAERSGLPVPIISGLVHYQFVTIHPYHNYYFGRSEADLTAWLEYFISTLAEVFLVVRQRAQKCAENGTPAKPDALRRLDHRARRILGLFAQKEILTTSEVAGELGLSERMARNLLADWAADGWLQVANPSRRARTYRLSAKYRQYISSLSAMPDRSEEGKR